MFAHISFITMDLFIYVYLFVSGQYFSGTNLDVYMSVVLPGGMVCVLVILSLELIHSVFVFPPLSSGALTAENHRLVPVHQSCVLHQVSQSMSEGSV